MGLDKTFQYNYLNNHYFKHTVVACQQSQHTILQQIMLTS